MEEIIFPDSKTKYLEKMVNLFYGCSSLKYLNLDFVQTSFVSNMKKIFYNCQSLKEINIIDFDVKKVEDMIGMF